MAKKGKIGPATREAIDDIVATPITSAFGGKAVILESFRDAVQALIDSDVEAVSPTLIAKIAWGAIKDGHSVIGGQEEDEEEPWTEDELVDLSAKELRAEAKFFKVRLTSVRGGKSGRFNKKTRLALTDAILEAQNEYFGIEDDDEDEPYTKAELKKMKASELRDILDDWDVEYPKKAKAKALVKLVLSSQEEDEEDEEDDDALELYTKAELKSYTVAELKEIAGEWELTVKKPTKKTLAKAILKFQTEELE